jgi:hypothetical protein
MSGYEGYKDVTPTAFPGNLRYIGGSLAPCTALGGWSLQPSPPPEKGSAGNSPCQSLLRIGLLTQIISEAWQGEASSRAISRGDGSAGDTNHQGWCIVPTNPFKGFLAGRDSVEP